LIEIKKEVALVWWRQIHCKQNRTKAAYLHRRMKIHIAILSSLDLLLLFCCIKPLDLTAFLAALKMISATYGSIPIIEAISLGPLLHFQYQLH
jgi:hypothetical protein